MQEATDGRRVVRELNTLVEARGRPVSCLSDNGTELTSMAILHWSQEMRTEWHRAWGSETNSVSFRSSSRSRPLKLSTKASHTGIFKD